MNMIRKSQNIGDRFRGFLVAMPPLLWLIIFVIAPIFVLLLHSFFGVGRYELGTHLTFANYDFLLDTNVFGKLFIRTLIVAFITTAICIFLAYPIAYQLTFRSKHTQLLLSVLLLPYLAGYIPRLLALRMILGTEGIINQFLLGIHVINQPITSLVFSDLGTVIGLVYIQLPIMIILLFISFEQISKSFLEASIDLGASPFYTLLHVLIPLSRSGLLAGVLLVFLPCIGAFVEPSILGGANGQLMGNIIGLRFITFMDMSRGSAMAMFVIFLLLILSFTFAYVIQIRSRKNEKLQ